MDDLLSEFLTETNESLAVLDLELVKLEQNPNEPGLLSNIFRIVHTIKGTCGFLGLPRLEALAHASENVLGKIRDGEHTVTPQAVSLILKSLDQIKSLLAQLEQNEAEPAGDDAELIQHLNQLAAGGQAPSASAPAPAPKPAAAPAKPAAASPPSGWARWAGRASSGAASEPRPSGNRRSAGWPSRPSRGSAAGR